MKLNFICIGRFEESLGGDGIIYTYKFGLKKISEDINVQRTLGDFAIKTLDVQSYKVGHEYTIIISDLITLGVGDFKSFKGNN